MRLFVVLFVLACGLGLKAPYFFSYAFKFDFRELSHLLPNTDKAKISGSALLQGSPKVFYRKDGSRCLVQFEYPNPIWIRYEAEKAQYQKKSDEYRRSLSTSNPAPTAPTPPTPPTSSPLQLTRSLIFTLKDSRLTCQCLDAAAQAPAADMLLSQYSVIFFFEEKPSDKTSTMRATYAEDPSDIFHIMRLESNILQHASTKSLAVDSPVEHGKVRDHLRNLKIGLVGAHDSSFSHLTPCFERQKQSEPIRYQKKNVRVFLLPFGPDQYYFLAVPVQSGNSSSPVLYCELTHKAINKALT